MAIYQLSKDSLTLLSVTRFDVEGFFERHDIQRLLKQNIEVLGEKLFVIAEEFSAWSDSSRRIDLLCLNADANLVIVELKRTEDGSYMDLQALRYAAMVSPMTFQQMVEAHARYTSPAAPDIESAKAAILEFLGWQAANEEQFGEDVQIILASADFGKELTTSVVWLNERGLDIRCIRLKPYRNADGQVFLDVQQLIPLPEVAEFQTQIGVKKQAERKGKAERHSLRYRFWSQLLDLAKNRTDIHGNRSPGDGAFISGSINRGGFSLNYVTRQQDSQAELWIGLGKGKDQIT